MGEAEKLTAHILAEADTAAAQITTAAQVEVQAIRAQAEAEAKAARSRILSRAQARAEEVSRRILTMAELESRKELLGAKQQYLEQAFTDALARLGGLEPAEYQPIIRRMLLECVESGTEVVYIAPADAARITPEFIASVNAGLVQAGKVGQLTLATERVETGGGFVLGAGEIKVNNSFVSIVKMLRDELEPTVAEILFHPE